MSEEEHRVTGLGRLIALSDNVFGFAMTLLAIGLVLPATTTDRTLAAHLAALGPNYFVFALSFLVIGLYWSAHRRIFHNIVRSDEALVLLDLVLLLAIAFMPFPTKVYAEFTDTAEAAILYAATLAATGLVMAVIWAYATHRRRLVPRDLSPAAVRAGFASALVNVLVFGLSIPVALVSPSSVRYAWFAFAAIVVGYRLVTGLRRRYG